MLPVRLSLPAEGDLAAILATGDERWGVAGRARYAALLAAAMQSIARAPRGTATRDRSTVLPGLRSLHLARVRGGHGGHGVRSPAHVIYYRIGRSAIEIVHVLHERMDPGARLAPRG